MLARGPGAVHRPSAPELLRKIGELSASVVARSRESRPTSPCAEPATLSRRRSTSPADGHQPVAGRRASPDPRNEVSGREAWRVRHPRMERRRGEDQVGVRSGPQGEARESRARESYLAACKTRADAPAKVVRGAGGGRGRRTEDPETRALHRVSEDPDGPDRATRPEGEKLPRRGKIFSAFEPRARRLSKDKAGHIAELGVPVAFSPSGTASSRSR